jgi:hypothetical protein
MSMAPAKSIEPTSYILDNGARRRRSGGGPGRGCDCRPVGTYLYLRAVGDGNPVAVRHT